MHGRRSWATCAAVDLLKLIQVDLTLSISLMRKWPSEHRYNIQSLFKLTSRKLLLALGNMFVKTKILRWKERQLRKGCQEASVEQN